MCLADDTGQLEIYASNANHRMDEKFTLRRVATTHGNQSEPLIILTLDEPVTARLFHINSSDNFVIEEIYFFGYKQQGQSVLRLRVYNPSPSVKTSLSLRQGWDSNILTRIAE